MKFLAGFLIVSTAVLGCLRDSGLEKEVTLTLAAGNCANPRFVNERITVCFDSLLTDSRCPSEVQCFWQGYAACLFDWRSATGRHPLRLSTLALPGILPKDTILDGYRITLVDLIPYPTTTQSPKDGLKAILKITRI